MEDKDLLLIMSCARTRGIVLQVLGENISYVDLSDLNPKLLPLLLMVAKLELEIGEIELEIEKVVSEVVDKNLVAIYT